MRRTAHKLIQPVAFLALLIAGLIGSAHDARAQEQAVKVRTDIVNVDVLVRRKEGGTPVAGLKAEDFTIYENGVKQTISHFSQSPLPLSIVLLIDRAGCINAYTDEIRDATLKAFAGLAEQHEVAIFTFSSKVKLVQPFTRDPQVIAAQLGNVERQHHSEQHYFNSGVYEAATYMSKAANPVGRRVIVVLTSIEASIDFSRRSEKDALHAVLESGACVWGLLTDTASAKIEQGIRGKPTSLLKHIGLRAGSLKVLAAETGGEVMSAAPGKLDAAVGGIFTRLGQSYSLGYLPTNAKRDGTRRKLRVELAPAVGGKDGKLVVTARRSYVMPKD